MNSRGLYTLFIKEVNRFIRVSVQTVLTPVITSLLYLVVFAQVLEGRVQVYPGINYLSFLVPGLIMMTIIQNAYANTSSTLIQAKMNGSITFLLLAPLSSIEILSGYIGAAVMRGFIVGLGVFIVSSIAIDMPMAYPGVVLIFVIISSMLLGGLGIVAGIWANQFEQMAAFQNFIILPLSFLSGVFYSIHQLPETWKAFSQFNPFFYMVDGFRYGFLGVSDVSPWLSFLVIGVSLLIILSLAMLMLATGYKLRQ